MQGAGDDQDTGRRTSASLDPGAELPPFIGRDERRLQVRAHRFWTELLAGRELPLIADLDAAPPPEFAANAILIDFSGGAVAISFVGDLLRAEAGLSSRDLAMTQVPARSLISRLTDRCHQVIASRTALGFEAEFVNHCGVEMLYRGLLLPFSRTGAAVDFVFGVINWKEGAGQALSPRLALVTVPEDGLLRTRPARPLWREAPVTDWLRRGGRG
ncbi:MAG: hypothetical protein ACKOXK_07005 [Chakrabartia sp.]